MKFCLSALVLILVPALVTGHVAPCSVDETLRSIVSQYCGNVKMECTSIQQNGAYSSCPAGYAATGCSCGMGCGSYDIQPSNKCHCQCGNIDWTAAICCRTRMF